LELFRILNGESLKIAVVGLGKMGLVHASVLNAIPNVRVTALCDKNNITRILLRKVFRGIRFVDDVTKLAGLDLDAVFVTTPISSHFPVVKTTYLGKIARNLFVEKTLASSYDQAKELCRLAQSFGAVNMVGYLRRFAVTFGKAKNLLTHNIIGEVSSFKAYACSSDFLDYKMKSKTPIFREGVLKDLGCHAIDLALWFFGDFDVESIETVPGNTINLHNSARFAVRKPYGLEGEFVVSWCMKNYRMPEVGFVVSGSKGSIDVNDDRLVLKLNDAESSTWYRHDLNDNVRFCLGFPEYFREDYYFVESVRENRNADPNFDAASKVDRIIAQVNCKVN
jgi:predicted dehydrogenase